MGQTISSMVTLFLVLLVIALLAVVVWLYLKRRPAARIEIHSSLQQIRSIGHLSVFKVITKEIVTETDHSWGEFGAKYLSWVLSQKKMAMIFEFEIDFRYNLRSDEFTITEQIDHSYAITMPPCLYDVHIRDIKFYDEQKSRLLPWLLPDLLNGFLLDGFSEDHRNHLVAAAKTHAQEQARHVIDNLESEVQTSARNTLLSISQAFGADNVRFEFVKQTNPVLQIAFTKKAV
jgi:Protein of unknown function (DUF4230)